MRLEYLLFRAHYPELLFPSFNLFVANADGYTPYAKALVLLNFIKPSWLWTGSVSEIVSANLV